MSYQRVLVKSSQVVNYELFDSMDFYAKIYFEVEI